MVDLERIITRVLENYRPAVYAKDVGAFMKLYGPQVRVFDTWGVWSYGGAPSWQRAIEAWFTSLGAEKTQVAFDDARTSGDADFAAVTAIVTYAGLSAQGEQLRAKGAQARLIR